MRLATYGLAATALLLACGGPDAGQANNAQAKVPVRTLSKVQALKVMHERHEGMETIGKTNKVLRREIAAENVAGIRPAAKTMESLAGKASHWFTKGTGPELGKTGAKPEIWQKPEDFAARLRDFQGAARALDAAARSGDLTRIKAGYADLGKSCKACHDSYRTDMHH